MEAHEGLRPSMAGAARTRCRPNGAIHASDVATEPEVPVPRKLVALGHTRSMGEHPSGGSTTDDIQIRTFLIADVRGYTIFTNQRGDEAAAKLAAKFADMATEAIAARGGSVIELRGDEALAVFSSARQAIRAALDLQARFVEETLADPSLPLPVGIGIDAGEAVPVAGGYRGGALNLAARLCGQAGPGEVLASAEAVHLARKIDGVLYVDRGTVQLKGLEEPVRVIKVIPEGDDPADLLKPITQPGSSTTARRSEGRRRTALIAAIAIVVVIALVAVVIPLLRSDPGVEALPGSGLQMLSSSSRTVTGSLPVKGTPGGITAGGGFIWVTDTQGDSVTKVDPVTHAAVDTIDVGGDPTGIAWGDGSIWVVESNDADVARIDPSSGRIVARIPVGNSPSAVAATASDVWVTNFGDDSVTRIDPATSKPVGRVNVGDGPTAVAADEGGAWVVSINDGRLTRVQSGSGTTTGIRVGNGPVGVAIGAGSVWVSNGLDGTLSQVDPDTGVVTATLPIGDGPAGVSAGSGSIWVANRYGGSIAQVDPATAQVRPIPVAGAPFASAVVDEVVWVATLASPNVHRGGTLHVGGEHLLDTIDPATAYSPESWSILPMTNDGLVAFQRVGGPQGAAIVPDLATSIPQPSDGGRTLTFHLRPGIRYSDGTPVRPEDFRLALERTFALKGGLSLYFTKIVGATACVDVPKTCDLSAGIETDDAEGTVTFHLTRPDAELLYALAMPAAFAVPRGTPLTAIGSTPLPATGAYRITSYTPGQGGSIELQRNPRFVEWSRAAKPDGYPDVVHWTFGMTPDDQVTATEKGSLDYMFDTPPPSRLRELQTRYPGQFFDQASPSTWGFSINVTLAPFDDLRVRQALQFAVDRKRMVADGGGKALWTLTCQICPRASPRIARTARTPKIRMIGGHGPRPTKGMHGNWSQLLTRVEQPLRCGRLASPRRADARSSVRSPVSDIG